MGYVIFQSDGDLIISNKITDGNISFESLGNGNVLLKDGSTYFVDSDSDGKRVKFDLANLTFATFRTISIPDNDGTMALTSDLHNRQHSINSANDHTGILPINMGGTNSNSTPTSGALMYYDGANQKIVGSSATISDSMITANLTGNVTGNVSGNAGYATLAGSAGTVTNGVYTSGDQTIGGTKTFTNTISGSISGNAGTVTNGVYTSGDQTIGGTKTFTSTISGSISGNAASSNHVNSSLYLGTALTFSEGGSSWDGSAGRTINVDLGTGVSQAAAGNHTHTGIYAPTSHTHATSDITSGNLNISRMPTGGTWSLSSALATSGAYDVDFANNISVASGKKISLNGAGGNNYLIRNVRNAQECIDFYVNGVARGFLGFNGATWGFFAL